MPIGSARRDLSNGGIYVELHGYTMAWCAADFRAIQPRQPRRRQEGVAGGGGGGDLAATVMSLVACTAHGAGTRDQLGAVAGTSSGVSCFAGGARPVVGLDGALA